MERVDVSRALTSLYRVMKLTDGEGRQQEKSGTLTLSELQEGRKQQDSRWPLKGPLGPEHPGST